MNKLKSLAFFATLVFVFLSCNDEKDLSGSLAGFWKQDEIIIDDQNQILNNAERNTSLLLEANGVYRMFDGVQGAEHVGTWMFSDGDWMNMSMDKIQGINQDSTYRFNQVLVRFTVLRVDAEYMELRIKTFLIERKLTVMFNLMDQDETTAMTGEEKLSLDTKNKEQHTYRYIFKKVNL